VLAELADLVDTVDASLERFDVTTSTRRLERFVDDLSNWYVRRGRRRFWKAVGEDQADKLAAYATLHTCLVTVAELLAPFTPFLADRLWQDLVVSQDPDAPVSVHLATSRSPTRRGATIPCATRWRPPAAWSSSAVRRGPTAP
jgi:isoleucyl-tRNA synthetase